MPTTPNCQTIEALVLADFPDAQFGRYNCRHIGSNPLRSWSQHAGSEPDRKYFGNALDITHKDFGYTVTPAHTIWLRKVYGFLRSLNVIDQLLGPGDAGHANHVHVSTWPKMKSNFWYKPPCKGGALVVIYEDGTTGDTFGDSSDKEEEMDYRKMLNLWGPEGLEKLRVAGRWSGITAYYFDGRSDAEEGANQNIVEHIMVNDATLSVDESGEGTPHPHAPEPHTHPPHEPKQHDHPFTGLTGSN